MQRALNTTLWVMAVYLPAMLAIAWWTLARLQSLTAEFSGAPLDESVQVAVVVCLSLMAGAGILAVLAMSVLARRAPDSQATSDKSPEVTASIDQIAVGARRDALERDLSDATRFRVLAALHRGVAHDLRGPLNNMVVNLELLKHACSGEGDADDSPALRRTEVIKKEIFRLDRFVQALLEMSAPSSGSEEVTDLVQILDEVALLVRAQAKAQRVECHWQVPQQAAPVRGERVALRQVMLNLVLNALQATPSGGALHVTLRHGSGEDVEIEVRDTGGGIQPHLQGCLFDLHTAGSDATSGTGLYVARALCRQMNGELTCDSAPGEGGRFRVRLPFAQPDM